MTADDTNASAPTDSMKPDELFEPPSAQSAQSQYPVNLFVANLTKQVNAAIAPYDAAIGIANEYLRAVLMYDFGTSRLKVFGAADVDRQPALAYLQSTATMEAKDADVFAAQLASACSTFANQHGREPGTLQDVQLVMAAFDLNLPPAPAGTIYSFDATSQTLMIEPRGVGIPFIACWLLLGGIILTLRMKFINIRGFFHAVAIALGRYRDSSQPGEISHVRAFTTSLASTMGLGAIGAVVIAVGVAGPGAAFWIMISALLGMSLKFSECSLAQIHRRVGSDGTVLGGAMRSMSHGFKQKRAFGLSLAPLGKTLGFCFAIICMIVALVAGNAFQVSQSLASLQTVNGLEVLQTQPWLFGAAMTVLVSFVVFGSARWLGRVTQLLTPLALLLYIAACAFVISTHWPQAQSAFTAIFTEAFNIRSAMLGGLVGVVVIGLSQATLSTDAGLGTSSIIHAAARSDEPTREGIIAMLETFVVGVVLCLLTAMTISVSGAASSDAGQSMIENKQATSLLMSAFANDLPPGLAYAVLGAFCIFAFSACIAWCYVGERCLAHLIGPSFGPLYKIVFVIFTFLGSVLAVNNLMTLSQLLLLVLAIPNMIAVICLHGIVAEELDDYWARLRAGKFKRSRVKIKKTASE